MFDQRIECEIDSMHALFSVVMPIRYYVTIKGKAVYKAVPLYGTRCYLTV